MRRGILTSILLTLVMTFAFGQKIKKTLKQANEMYEDQDYRHAIPLYKEVLKVDKTNIEANFKLGHCYLNTTFNHKAEEYLNLAYTYNRDYDPEIRRDLGYAKQINHKFEEAIEYYNLELGLLHEKKDADKIMEVKKHIAECNNGIELVKSPVDVKIENVGGNINGPFPDFVPVITADRSIMVYTSRRDGNIGEFAIDENGNETFKHEDIYISDRNGDKWGKPRNMGTPVNSEEHDANIALSPDGSKLFIYKSSGNGDIYISELKGKEWSKPKQLGKTINTKYAELHVSMTADEQTLYFSSNRPGGSGDFDIYMSKKKSNGAWGEAINLGPEINTQYKEDAPFIHADGKSLYFSSQGHQTMGGYDIFESHMDENGKWTKPANIGYPINTADDDIYFVISADKKFGYYASAKADTRGEKDIYVVKWPEPEPPKKDEPKKVVNPITMLKGTITDALTEKPLGAKILIVDNEKNQVISEMHSNEATGNYLVILPSGKNYGIAVQHPDYMFHSENFDIPSSEDYQEVTKDVELKKVAIGTKIILRNIFFDFDRATLRPESTAELERLTKLLNDLPNLKIEISGHTDSKGSDEYNKKLSERRAKTVVDHLIGKGIATGRLQFAGYGEERPIDTNDTDEGRQQNRRTEFEIIGN